MPLAQRGGMRPEVRVFRWREIARITLQQFSGDLNPILDKPYDEAKRALKQFPNIGDPGAEKILLFCGMALGLPLESNGLRVLVRVGWAASIPPAEVHIEEVPPARLCVARLRKTLLAR
jgi:endonuclease-3